MATISITIPDAILQRVLDGFCAVNGYEEGAETKSQFARRKIIEYVKSSVLTAELNAARNNVINTEKPRIEGEIIIT